MASRYCVIKALDETRRPEGGMIDPRPVAGGGGGVTNVCREGPGGVLVDVLDGASEDHVKDNVGVIESDSILSRMEGWGRESS